ncbi:hypothetical protein AZ049_004426 [Escherichia coli]|nr:hypothetical protein AZ049_004426 [Escherichia coli]
MELEFREGILSVSYTHLDVYKRQVYGIRISGRYITVSYTHLDVYKRQIIYLPEILIPYTTPLIF